MQPPPVEQGPLGTALRMILQLAAVLVFLWLLIGQYHPKG